MLETALSHITIAVYTLVMSSWKRDEIVPVPSSGRIYKILARKLNRPSLSGDP